MVAEAITAAPEGMVTELGALGRSLAARYGADACCPVTVRRHLRTIAEDAFENAKRGEAIAKVTPFRRVVDPASLLAGRLAGGEQFIRERQAGER
jgi:hypothetical protein